MQKYLWDLGWELGLAFCSTQLATQVPNLTSKKVLPCRHPCHSWDLGLGAMCEVVSPNFHALNGWDCIIWSHVTWDLGLGTMSEVVSPKFHVLNGWDCMDWSHVTWDLGLGTYVNQSMLVMVNMVGLGRLQFNSRVEVVGSREDEVVGVLENSILFVAIGEALVLCLKTCTNQNIWCWWHDCL